MAFKRALEAVRAKIPDPDGAVAVVDAARAGDDPSTVGRDLENVLAAPAAVPDVHLAVAARDDPDTVRRDRHRMHPTPVTTRVHLVLCQGATGSGGFVG